METVVPGRKRAGPPPAHPAARAPARGRRSRPRRPAVTAAAVAAVTLALPPFLDGSQVTVYILLGLSAMVALGLTLLMGFAGQVSLGQAAFSAIGAYAAALLATHGAPPLLGLAAAPAAAACAAVIGGPLLRLRGHQLAFATLAAQLILVSLLGEWEWAGGSIGVTGIPLLSLGGFTFDEDLHYAYLTWAALALLVVLAHNVTASRAGRALRALATSETAASASGVPVARYKLAVFVLAAAFAGLAGGIYAFFIGYIAPHSFPVLLSVEYLVMVVVGGLGSLWGALLGAAAITLLVQVLSDLATLPGMPATAPSIFSYAVYATLLVVVVLFLPRGLVSLPVRVRRGRPRDRAEPA